jgi:pyruvate ferredoxin oxidoreductase beta subunit
MKDTVLIGQMGIDCCIWPLYEVENGVYRLTYKPKEKKPVTDWLKSQGRFRHLFKPGNEKLLEMIQANVDKNWDELLGKCKEGQ